MFLFLLCTLIIINCNEEEGGGTTNNSPNILLIIADDFGKDACSGFQEGNIKPNTPNIDNIRNDGLSFNNFWVYPTCSPTRASMITGKYGYRTGVKWAGDELDESETILHKYIKDESDVNYATAIVGKWHLSGNNATIDPVSFGMDYYAGLIDGGVQNYYNWRLFNNGSSSLQNTYITEGLTDLAIDWVGSQSKPWFLWLAYNAPHLPFHAPPAEMHSQGDLIEYEDGIEPMPYYMAAIEAMDFQIGRLFESMSTEERENTIIIFIGDNGTPNQVAQLPFSNAKAKGSLYQGGINVPLFVSGPGITRNGEDENIICSTDMFSTIAELAGIDVPEIHDSKSIAPLFTAESDHRDFQYSEKNNNGESWTISNGEYKLIQDDLGNEEMYHLSNDPYENENLLDGDLTTTEMTAKETLVTALTNIRN